MNDLYIMHYGVGHDKGGHSGRYPWGSGDNKIIKTAKAIKERGINDVIAGKIVSQKAKNNAYADAGQAIADKERIKAFLKNTEMMTVGMLVSTTLGIAGTVGLRTYYTYKDFKKANNFIDDYGDVNVEDINVDNIQLEKVLKEDHA